MTKKDKDKKTESCIQVLFQLLKNSFILLFSYPIYINNLKKISMNN